MKSDLQRSLNLLKVRFSIGGVLLLVAMIDLSIVWNHSIKEELALQATTFVRRTLSAGESRRVIESLNGVRLASFESITQFDRDGQRIVTLPPSIAPVAYAERGFWHKIIYAEDRTILFLDDEGENAVGSLSFEYLRFGLAHYAIGVWLILVSLLGVMLVNARQKVTKEFQREIELQNSKLIHDLIQKVRHNIRSPLAVLGAYFTAPKESGFDLKEQGQRAVRRIEEILSEMEEGNNPTTVKKVGTPEKALIEISMLAQQIVEEKKLIAPKIDFSFSASEGPIYAAISAMEFKTTLSNIIDNSVQAIVGNGFVKVRLEADGHLVSLEIVDSGCGIPKDLISSLTQKHFSHGKEDGSGLGLFYAQKLMDNSRGSLQIESEVDCGTTITLCFPQVTTPSWHCDEISLDGIKQVHVYDDQAIVLDLFRRKFSNLNADVRYHLVDKIEPLPRAAKNHIHFMDFDFGADKKNGLQIISESGVGKQTVLVTGHYDDPIIQAACLRAGCRLLQKDRISSIKIVERAMTIDSVASL